MSQQDPLFHEDFRDALRHAIKALGGYEAVAVDLWPTKAGNRKAAATWLSDCLNPERPAKLDLEDLVKILEMARAAGIHCAMHRLCDEIGYARAEIAPARTPRQELVDRMERCLAEFKRLADEEAAIQHSETLAQIRTAKRP
jgi:hypothetical protein